MPLQIDDRVCVCVCVCRAVCFERLCVAEQEAKLEQDNILENFLSSLCTILKGNQRQLCCRVSQKVIGKKARIRKRERQQQSRKKKTQKKHTKNS